jgi:ATP-dependent exoDNAse (exonuclease V) alpha subunit
MAELDKRDLQYQCLAPTNKAARLMHSEAMTLHKFFNSFKDAKATGFLAENKYYIIDEISMVGSGFYRVLLYLSRRLPDSRFIVIGDMAQLCPVGDIANFNYENSVCLWEICGGNLIELVQCRRADTELFELSKAASLGADVSEWIDKMPGKHYPKSVAFTNRSRIKVNNYWMKKLRPKRSHESIFIPRVAKMKKSEDLWVYEGLPVIAIVTRKEEEMDTKIANTDEYEVLSFNKDKRLIRLALKDSDGHVTNEVIKVNFDKFARLFRAAYCITVHAAQGTTIKDTPYTIYDYDHPRFDKRLKYVALSRASDIRFINIDRREYKSKWLRKDIEELVEVTIPDEEPGAKVDESAQVESFKMLNITEIL